MKIRKISLSTVALVIISLSGLVLSTILLASADDSNSVVEQNVSINKPVSRATFK